MYYVLDSKKLSSDIYSLIDSHLDEILVISENSQDLKDNIKLFTYLYLEDSGAIYFVEGFGDVLDTIKTIFWSTTLPAWSGKISLTNWLGGMLTNVAAGNDFRIATSIIGQIVNKILGITGPTVDIVARVSSAQLIKVASLAIFPTIMVGLILYRLITYKDILLIKNFETAVISVSDNLRVIAKQTIPGISTLNTKYNEILVNNCSSITDEPVRLKCASTYYVKYVTEDILTSIIIVYIGYLKNRNFDVSYLTSFYDLVTMGIGVNPLLSKRLNYLYEFYLKLLKSYVFEDKLRQQYIQLLNDTVIKEINK